MERSHKFGLQLLVLFDFDKFAIQPNFVTRRVDSRFNAFVISLLLKLLSVKEVLSTDSYELSKL